MLSTSRKTLINISAVVWVVGGILLLIKGIALIKEAHVILPSTAIISIVLLIALIFGLIKSKFIMAKFCRKNLKRIDTIKEPKIHQFFELRFFMFLMLMILIGITLSRFAEGSYGLLLAVGGLDLTLSTALLTSTSAFYNNNQARQK